MHRTFMAALVAFGLAPMAGAAQPQQPQSTPAAQAGAHQITFRGCVTPGVDKGSYVMTNIVESPSAAGATMPEVAHGRRILYWLDNDAEVKQHIGEMVEVNGEFTELEKSEIELKAGPQKDGGLVVEFETPGKDVKAPNATVGTAVGTAGRVVPETNDIPTFLAHIDVKSVKAMGKCK
jgi:hypothetical protein